MINVVIYHTSHFYVTSNAMIFIFQIDYAHVRCMINDYIFQVKIKLDFSILCYF